MCSASTGMLRIITFEYTALQWYFPAFPELNGSKVRTLVVTPLAWESLVTVTVESKVTCVEYLVKHGCSNFSKIR